MNIFFLGTGGGRVNLIIQRRHTGGFIIFSKSVNMYVDPGPGALVYSKKKNVDLRNIDALFVSHNHIDHTNDANVIIEGMTHFGVKKMGVLFGSKTVINGENGKCRSITKYHQSKLGRVIIGEPEQKQTIETKKGKYTITFTKTKHDETTGIGFVLETDGKKIGYTSDTEYFKGIGRQFEKVDLLIVNCLKPWDDRFPGHMTTNDVIKIANESKAKKVVLTHLGMRMLKAGPQKEANKIEKQTNVETIAAKDNIKIDI